MTENQMKRKAALTIVAVMLGVLLVLSTVVGFIIGLCKLLILLGFDNDSAIGFSILCFFGPIIGIAVIAGLYQDYKLLLDNIRRDNNDKKST